MDPNIYKFLHLAGVMILFTALGGLIYAGPSTSKKTSMILHGVALVLILLGGFGMIAKLHANNFAAGWVIAKMVIWLVLGASLSLAKRQVMGRGTLTIFVLGLGIAAAYLGIFKPF